MKSTPRVATVLVGLLLLGTVMILLGRDDRRSNPSAGSYAPSGLRAFRTLLEQRGFAVRLESDPIPKLEPWDLAIVVAENESLGFRGPTTALVPEEESEPPVNKLRERLDRHLAEGGALLEAHLNADFRRLSDESQGTTEVAGMNRKFAISGKPSTTVEPEWVTDSDDSFPLFTSENWSPCIWVERGAGRGILVNNAVGMTNRFVDRGQNADMFLALVSSLAREKGSVVFVEAASGNAVQPGLLRSIGEWLLLGWWQVLITGLVIAYTLGRRLGLPEFERPVQTGQRQLVDALSEIYRRGRATGPALRAFLQQSDRELRRIAKVAQDVPRETLDERLPDAVLSARYRAENAAAQNAPADQAIRAAAKYEAAIRELRGGRRTPGRRRRQ